MTTITLEVPDELASQLDRIGNRLPSLLAYVLSVAGISASENKQFSPNSPVWQEAIDFLASNPHRQEIIDFKLSSKVQSRLEELLQLQHQGSLSPLERAEIETYRQINHLFVLLKARSRAA